MNRRRLCASLMAFPASSFIVAMARAPATSAVPHRRGSFAGTGRRLAQIPLTSSGPVTSRADGQVVENLDIDAGSGNAVTVTHRGVTVRNCRIRHAGGHGVHAEGAAGLVLHDLEIEFVGVSSHARLDKVRNNVNLEGCPYALITRVKASRGSSNIYAESSKGAHLSILELHDARGPMPRGQNVQLNQSPNSTLEDFSAENGPTSWTEDNVSVFRSDRCRVRRGLVFYNNSPTGDGVMIEGSFACLVEDVDAMQQGNGAFAAVPADDAGCGGCTFLRCRTRDTYNARRDGREAPTSNGLSFYTRISPGAQKHTIIDCHYYALAKPENLIWQVRAVNPGWSFTPRAFAPRSPIRLRFRW